MYTTAGFTLAAMSAKFASAAGAGCAAAGRAPGAGRGTAVEGASGPATISPTSNARAEESATVKSVNRRVTSPL